MDGAIVILDAIKFSSKLSQCTIDLLKEYCKIAEDNYDWPRDDSAAMYPIQKAAVKDLSAIREMKIGGKISPTVLREKVVADFFDKMTNLLVILPQQENSVTQLYGVAA